MADIHGLLNRMAAQEAAFRETQFVAPCVRGGQVRARVAGLIQNFTPKPADFEGWGLFQMAGEKEAEVVEEAALPLVEQYLKLLMPLRMRLLYPLAGSTWLAYPINESDALQRLGTVRPLPVFLVEGGTAFEPIVARGDGSVWWFEEMDRRADPQTADRLRDALRQFVLPENLRFPALTPEDRTAYDLTAQQTPDFRADWWRSRESDRRSRIAGAEQGSERLRNALHMAGGELRDARDRGDYWQVEWTTRDGQRHSSAISKQDLTVLSSGICLSDRDSDFDLQSLVGVIERRDEY